MTLSRSDSRKVESAFAIYLRTGYHAAPGVELKFNPWHDIENGRFTFVGQGRYYPNGHVAQDVPQRDREAAAKDIRDAYGGRRQPSYRDPYVPDYSDASPWHPKNWRVYVVRPGDSLARIARTRKGLTVDYLAGLNRIPKGKLRVGQMLMLPTQRSLDEARDAQQKTFALLLYMDTHGGKRPPNPANPPSIIDQANEIRHHYIANKYHFYTDLTERIQRVKADLYLGNGVRDLKVQKAAGGSDRLPTDHGGHIIARQFNGPEYFFNHFAQDRSFNRQSYAKLEYFWKRVKENKGTVYLDIHLFYPGLSRRPSSILVEYWANGKYRKREFPNSPEANANEQ